MNYKLQSTKALLQSAAAASKHETDNADHSQDSNKSKISFYNKLSASGEHDNMTNAFSRNWQNIKSNRPAFNKDDPTYAIPTNEKTLKRGIEANEHIGHEITELCQVIKENGREINAQHEIGIDFKTLFTIYTKISNKVVGILLRARKYGLVEFKGEMLFQGRDDDVIIKLKKLELE